LSDLSNGLTNNVSSIDKSDYINYSLLILSVGFLFKISAAPFHFWSPLVYDAIPTIVTTFVAIIAKISILIFLLELVHYTSNSLFNYKYTWTTSLLVSSFISLIIGSILGLREKRIKRLLAYSTISHLGFLLLALTINSIESIYAFIFYLLQYSISNLNVFIILISIGYSFYSYVNNSDNYKQLKDKNNSPAKGSGKPLLRVLWPNSRKLLKLLRPNCSWKAISGWTNHSCTVIRQKITERLMEYRGSKLVMFTNNITVKEQRVDGHRCVNLAHLRYALTGFEINSQIRIPSNHLNTSRRLYTCLPINLNPWFLTGFCDGESNFLVRIVKSNSVKVGWAVQPLFFFLWNWVYTFGPKDFSLLKNIRAFWGVGEIYYKENSCNYMVQSLRDLNIIVNHFERYPFLTKKREDFILFAQIVTLIKENI